MFKVQNITLKSHLSKLCSKIFSRSLHKLSGIKDTLQQNFILRNMSCNEVPYQNENGPTPRPVFPNSTPLFKFGIFTDVQYGDVDDRLNYEGTVMRYYRNSANLLMQAIMTWKSGGPKMAPDFILQLGDLIEGSRVETKDRDKNLKTVIDCCRELDCYFCHIWGNHEFYLFSRNELAKSSLNSQLYVLDKPDENVAKKSEVFINKIRHRYKTDENSGEKYYFTFSPHPKFKFIALDSYDISICGRQEHEPERQKANEILSKNNHNSDWNNPLGLQMRHFVKFNGGIGKEQLKWLENELKIAEKNDQNVIIMSHVPIHPGCTSDICLLWNYQEVLDIIKHYACMRVCFYGHTHDAGSCIDEKGVHHITYPAVLECKEDENAFVTAFVYENRINLVGHGVINSHVIEF